MGAPDKSVTPRKVLVAVVTRRRPRQLARLLEVLTRQVAEQALVQAGIMVVDNDVAGSAHDVVRDVGHSLVQYALQPVPGIAAARNAALDLAAQHDAVVFVDDDDLPSAGWFVELVGAWLRWNSDGVAGPLRSTLESDEPWVLHSGVFRRRTQASGTTVAGAATNNLLLSIKALRERGLRFDESLGATGGEDALLTHQLTSSGGSILWCNEAEVVSPVAEDRLTRRWVVRRLLRAGGSWSQMELRMASGSGARNLTRMSLLVRGAGQGLVSCLVAARWLVAGSRARSVAASARAVGYLGLTLGAMGWVHQEYRQVE